MAMSLKGLQSAGGMGAQETWQRNELDASTMPWYAKVNAARSVGLLGPKNHNAGGGGLMGSFMDAMQLEQDQAGATNVKFAGGASEPGSNQMRGVTNQPNFAALENSPSYQGLANPGVRRIESGDPQDIRAAEIRRSRGLR